MKKPIVLLFIIALTFSFSQCADDHTDSIAAFNKVENGIHLRTGLKDDPHLQTVIGACTPCHSAQLITQNRATRDGWEGMIRWMQESQGLGELGQAEPVILDYLAQYYAPEETGRRKNLDMSSMEWYELETAK